MFLHDSYNPQKSTSWFFTTIDMFLHDLFYKKLLETYFAILMFKEKSYAGKHLVC